MTELVLASNNRKKIAELETFFASASSNTVRVKTLSEIGWTEEIREDGESFEENSLIKASVPAGLGFIGTADDSGLAVDALGGAPGIFSARYSDPGATDAKNRAKLLEELAGVPEEKRTARFVSVVAFCDPERPERSFTVRGECPGVIARTGSSNAAHRESSPVRVIVQTVPRCAYRILPVHLRFSPIGSSSGDSPMKFIPSRQSVLP